MRRGNGGGVRESGPAGDLASAHGEDMSDGGIDLCPAVTDRCGVSANGHNGIVLGDELLRGDFPAGGRLADGLKEFADAARKIARVGNGLRTVIDPLGVGGDVFKYGFDISGGESRVDRPNEGDVVFWGHGGIPPGGSIHLRWL